jgi:acyl-CoA thioesterase-1
VKAIQAYLICILVLMFQLGAPSKAYTQTVLNIVAYGDSLTAGYGLKTTTAFPAQLQKALTARGHNVVVHNAGVSGDTATGGFSRLTWSLPKNTDAVILELGANDALRGVDPQQTLKALEQILQKLALRKIPVLLVGMRAPPNMGKAYGQKFNAIYPFLAKTYGVKFYPFFLKDVAARPKLNQADGIHPNDKGVLVIIKNILPSVEGLISSLKQRN